MESTSKRILELMKDQNISQKQLADALQVSGSTMNNYLKGRRWLNLSLIRRASRYLHTSSDYLLGLSDEKYPFYRPEDEMKLLDLYRSLPSHGQRFVLQQMRQLEQLCRQCTRLK